MANKRTAAIEAGFDYQYFWFWNYAIRMLSHNSEIKSVELEQENSSPLDDVVVRYWYNVVGITEYNRDFLQCKFKVNQSATISFEQLMNPKLYGNVESFFSRAYEFYLNEKERNDVNFRIILCTSANFETTDSHLISNNEGEIILDKIKSTQIFSSIKKHLNNTSDNEVLEFLSHFRFYTAKKLDEIKTDLKTICEIVGVKYDRSKIAEPFSSLAKYLNLQGDTSLDRKAIIEIFRNEELLLDDLYLHVWDCNFFDLKLRYYSEKEKWLKKANNNYASTANEYEKLISIKEAVLIKAREMITVATVYGLNIEQQRAIEQAKIGKWSEFTIAFDDDVIEEIFAATKEEQANLSQLTNSCIEEQNRLHRIWESKLGVLRLNISQKMFTAISQNDFEQIESSYEMAVSYARDNSLSKAVVYDYAVFLNSNRKYEQSLKAVEEYLKDKNSTDSLEFKVEALSFAQSLAVRLQKKQEKTLKLWGQAIEGWKELFNNEDETVRRKLLFNFQKFLRTSGDALLTDAFFAGEQNLVYGERTQQLFLSLHDLCQKVRERLNINIAMPNNVNDNYKNYIDNRIYASEWHPPREGDLYYGTILGEGNVSYQSILPFSQAEELFAYALSFSMWLIKTSQNMSDDCLIQLAKNCGYIAGLIINDDPDTANEFIAYSLDCYEKVEYKNNDIRLEIALCKANMAQALLKNDMVRNDCENKTQVESLDSESTKIIEEIYDINPQIYYVNLIQAYISEAERYRKYAVKDGFFSCDGEVRFLSKVMSLINDIEINEGDLSTIRAYADTIIRMGQIFESRISNKNVAQAIIQNSKTLINFCNKHAKKYPKTIRTYLYYSNMNLAKFYIIIEKPQKSLSLIRKALNVFIEMLKNDDRDAFICADDIFGSMFVKKPERFAHILESLRSSTNFNELERELLLELSLLFVTLDFPAIFLLPQKMRHHSYNSVCPPFENIDKRKERQEKDKVFSDDFSTIMKRTFNRLYEVMIDLRQKEELLKIGCEFLRKYLAIKLHGHTSFYHKKSENVTVPYREGSSNKNSITLFNKIHYLSKS